MVPLRGDSVDVCTADDAAAAECGGRNANGLAGAGVVSNVPRDFSGSSGVLSQLDDADRQLRSGALTPTPSTSGGGPTPHSPSIIARGGTPEAADTGHISSPPSAGRSSNDGQRPDDNSGDGAAMESIPAESSRQISRAFHRAVAAVLLGRGWFGTEHFYLGLAFAFSQTFFHEPGCARVCVSRGGTRL